MQFEIFSGPLEELQNSRSPHPSRKTNSSNAFLGAISKYICLPGYPPGPQQWKCLGVCKCAPITKPSLRRVNNPLPALNVPQAGKKC
jgi:hypothetical protein